MSPPYRIIAWADADQESLLLALREHRGIEIAAVGSPAAGVSSLLSRRLDAPQVDDLRAALLRDDVAAVWIASTDEADTTALRLVMSSPAAVFSATPLPSAAGDVVPSEDGALVHFVPLMRRSMGFRAVMEVLPQFGAIRSVSVNFRSGVGQGTLFSRLFDAIDLLDVSCGEAEMMDAALVGPVAGVPESLAMLRGHMTINLRFTESRCACVAVSDHAGSWFRGVTMLGEGGCLRISDESFEWVGIDGEVVDSFQEANDRVGTSYAMRVGDHLVRVLERRDSSEPQPDHARLLAICEAARLSCRTGQGEAPQKLLKMLRRP